MKRGASKIRNVADRLGRVVAKLLLAQDPELPTGAYFPSPQRLELVIRTLHELLFPRFYIEAKEASLKKRMKENSDKVLRNLSAEIAGALAYNGTAGNPAAGAASRVLALIEELPAIRAELELDLDAVLGHDPAAKDRAEVILAYPGFEALTVHRLAHFLHRQETPLVPRIMSEIVHRRTGIDIHPGASIASSCSIDHGTGLIIGETSVIGRNVSLYHNVTLGARSVSPEFRGRKRHPTIGDNVVIYPGSTILGDITVGSGSIIGGNSFLLESCPPNTRIHTKPPEMVMRSKGTPRDTGTKATIAASASGSASGNRA